MSFLNVITTIFNGREQNIKLHSKSYYFVGTAKIIRHQAWPRMFWLWISATSNTHVVTIYYFSQALDDMSSSLSCVHLTLQHVRRTRSLLSTVMENYTLLRSLSWTLTAVYVIYGNMCYIIIIRTMCCRCVRQ